MSRREYPIVGSARDNRKKWTYTDKRGRTKSQATRPRCAACGAEATHTVEIQVGWFRGDDEVRHSCIEHKGDAEALLKLNDTIDMDEEVQMLMDRDMGDGS